MSRVRTVEAAATGLLAASAAATALVSWQLLHARSVSPLYSEALLLVGTAVGGTLGFMRRPSVLATAVEVDRQLHLDELFSSAVSIQRLATADDDDPWKNTLLAAAEAKCADRPSHQLVFARLKTRAWAGVALAVALVAALNLFDRDPHSQSPEADRAIASSRQREGADPHSAEHRDVYGSVENRPIVLADPDDLSGSQFGHDGKVQTGPAELAASADADPSEKNGNVSPEPSATGGGAGRTDVAAHANEARTDTSHAVSKNVTAADKGVEAGGAGSATGNVKSGKSETLANSIAPVASRETAASAPPWTATNWPAEVRNARAAVEAGKVPASYSDLVQGYFSQN